MNMSQGKQHDDDDGGGDDGGDDGGDGDGDNKFGSNSKILMTMIKAGILLCV